MKLPHPVQKSTSDSMTLMMTSAQVVEASVIVTNSSPFQDYTHPDDHRQFSNDMTPGFKPFTMKVTILRSVSDFTLSDCLNPILLLNTFTQLVVSALWFTFSGLVLSGTESSRGLIFISSISAISIFD